MEDGLWLQPVALGCIDILLQPARVELLCVFAVIRCRCLFGCHPRRGSASVLAVAVASVLAVVCFCRHPERSEGPRYRSHLSTHAPRGPCFCLCRCGSPFPVPSCCQAP